MQPESTFQPYTLPGASTRSQVLDELAQIPATVRPVLAGLAPTDILRTPVGGGGAPFRPSATSATRHSSIPPASASSSSTWTRFSRTTTRRTSPRDKPDDLPGILGEIAASRSDLIRVLTRLDERGWHRTGRHELLGTVVLEDDVRHQVAHERMHLAQTGHTVHP